MKLPRINPKELYESLNKSVEEKENAFDEYVRNVLQRKVTEAVRKNSDFVLLITGKERSGKSNISLKILEAMGFKEELKRNIKNYYVLDVRDVLPLLEQRLKELESGKAKLIRPIVVDEGAHFYSKWRQMTKESYEVFQIFRLMGFAGIFWIIQYQDITDAGELFLKGRIDAWFYTFSDAKRDNYYVAVVPEYLIRKVSILVKLSRRFKYRLGIAHQFPSQFFYLMQRLAKRSDLRFLKIFKVGLAETYKKYYLPWKREVNRKRIEFLKGLLFETGDNSSLKKYIARVKDDDLRTLFNYMFETVWRDGLEQIMEEREESWDGEIVIRRVIKSPGKLLRWVREKVEKSGNKQLLNSIVRANKKILENRGGEMEQYLKFYQKLVRMIKLYYFGYTIQVEKRPG
ncbi:MAG: hypothetical protein DSY42_03060 [Aquifex sp.]|nr:MAG: hypothetical protein DSY42_03060 [Aquifex sp.]